MGSSDDPVPRLLASVATTPLALNLSRVVMGLGAVLFNPKVMGLLQRLYHGVERAHAWSYAGIALLSLAGLVVSMRWSGSPAAPGTGHRPPRACA